MAHKLAPPHAKLLREITEASKGPKGMHMANRKMVAHLETLGLVETNPDLVEGDTIAARLMPVAVPVDKLPEPEQSETPVETPVQPETKGTKKMAFAVESGIGITELPKTSRDARYPFAEMEVNSNFFVPATDKSYKSLSSAVATAQRRFSVADADGKTRINKKGDTVPVTSFTKKFSIRPVTKGHTYSNGFVEPEDGSRVFRVK